MAKDDGAANKEEWRTPIVECECEARVLIGDGWTIILMLPRLLWEAVNLPQSEGKFAKTFEGKVKVVLVWDEKER